MYNNSSSKGQGGYFEGEIHSQNAKNPTPQQNVTHGLIPITVNMFDNAVINKDGEIVYNGKVIHDCELVGYLIDIKELHDNNTMLLRIWDQTGSIQVTFHSNNEDGFIMGLNKIEFKG